VKRKILASLLAVAMVAGTSVPAWAEPQEDPSPETHDSSSDTHGTSGGGCCKRS
jgi:hypothetical protein